MFLRSVTCGGLTCPSVTSPRFIIHPYTKISDKTSTEKKTDAHNVKRTRRMTGYTPDTGLTDKR